MAKISKRLEEIRNILIVQAWNDKENTFVTVEDIGIIFGLTTSQIYNIIKEERT